MSKIRPANAGQTMWQRVLRIRCCMKQEMGQTDTGQPGIQDWEDNFFLPDVSPEDEGIVHKNSVYSHKAVASAIDTGGNKAQHSRMTWKHRNDWEQWSDWDNFTDWNKWGKEASL